MKREEEQYDSLQSQSDRYRKDFHQQYERLKALREEQSNLDNSEDEQTIYPDYSEQDKRNW